MEDLKALQIKRAWHELYIEKESDPFDIRTDKSFCEEIGLEPKTLDAWKRKYRPLIYAEVNKRRKQYLSELRSKNYKAIIKNLESSFQDRQLLAKLTGDLVERIETRNENLSPEDTKRRISSVLENIVAKSKAWTGEAEAGSHNQQEGTEKGPNQPNGEQGS